MIYRVTDYVSFEQERETISCRKIIPSPGTVRFILIYHIGFLSFRIRINTSGCLPTHFPWSNLSAQKKTPLWLTSVKHQYIAGANWSEANPWQILIEGLIENASHSESPFQIGSATKSWYHVESKATKMHHSINNVTLFILSLVNFLLPVWLRKHDDLTHSVKWVECETFYLINYVQ